MQENRGARPDYEKYAGIDLHEPPTWARLLARFRGLDLAVIAIAAITIYSHGLPQVVQLTAIVAVLVLGLAGALCNREPNAASSQKPVEGQAKPRSPRRNQATA